MAVEAHDLDTAGTRPVVTVRDDLPSAPRHEVSLRRVLVICDLVGFSLGWAVAWLGGGGHAAVTTRPVLLTELGVIVAAAMVSAAANGLYRTRINRMRVVAYSRLMTASLTSAVVAFAVSARVDAHPAFSRPILGAILAWCCVALGRYSFDFWLAKSRADGHHLRKVVLVGCGPELEEFGEYLAANPEVGYQVTAVVGGQSDPEIGTPWLGGAANARVAVATTGATGAIVIANGMPSEDVNEVARDLSACGVHVHLSSGLFGVNYRRLRAVPLGREPFFYIEAASLSPWQLAIKRAVDIVVAATLLVLSSPVLLLAAIAIKIEDRGPILFRQTRVGRDGRAITVHKLRTMSVDAEDRLTEIRHLNERKGPLFKTESDPRVTRVGALLRSTSIDEIPQLLDVLRGEMSVVGPRPALPEEVAEFDDALLGRLRVRPGVTGLWQVEARDKPSFDAYRRLDLFYVENWTLTLDLAIIIDTVPAVADRALRAIVGLMPGRRRRLEPTS